MTESDPTLPRAELVRRPRFGLAWLLPLLTLALVVALGVRAWSDRGPTVWVELDSGHGLGPGDAVRYRGIDVGSVRTMQLAPGLDRVRLEVALEPHAGGLAREGTRFWVARPRVGPSGVSGLDTLVGARYLAVDPGPAGAPARSRFDGLGEPPVEPAWGQGFEVTLEAATRGGVTAGAPVLYRQFPVGQVVSVGLSSDASTVEFALSIDPTYADLIRERTRFWESAGLELEFDLLGGLDLEFDGLESILAGSVALAAPNDPGPRVEAGRRFPLLGGPPEGWRGWRPDVPLGAALLPAGTLAPRPARVDLTWKERGWFGGDEARTGWVLRVPGGWLGPVDLVCTPQDAAEDSVRLTIDSRSVPTRDDRPGEGALTVVADDGPGAAWPAARLRTLDAPEDVLVFGDLTGVPRALDGARLELDGERLRIDRSLSIPSSQHGAPVIARADGALIGLLVVSGEGAWIAPPPPSQPASR
ncbi:MAG: MlaD family protein [Planctomycetota bacterium]